MSQYEPNSAGLLKPMQKWLDDKDVSEIIVNRPQELHVEKNGVFSCYKVPEYDQNMLHNLFQLLASENKQRLNAKHPLLSGSLLDGSRIQLVIPPVAKHYTFAIRRKVARNLSLSRYKDTGFYSKLVPHDIATASFDMLPETEQELLRLFRARNWDAFVRKAIMLRKNIVISGGTSSGKTTYLNACLQHIAPSDRVITLEDTRELDLPHQNKVELLASKGDTGLAKVSMQDLVQCCLRLRPDRIIMGEVRGKEIMDFVSACSTGHEGSLTTIHANNPKIAFMRMVAMYKLNNVPSMKDQDILKLLQEVIDIIIQINKTGVGRKAHGIYYKYMDVHIS